MQKKSANISIVEIGCRLIMRSPLVIVLFLLLILPQAHAQQTIKKPVPTQALFNQGKALYQKQCAVCHGPSGAGDGKASTFLYPKPRNFNLNEFRLISTNNMQATDEDLFKTISRGMPGSSMPSWAHLSEEERWALVYVVRYFSEIKNFKESGEINDQMLKNEVPWKIVQKMIRKKIDPESFIEVPAETAVTQEGLKRGRELFVKACAACHGLQGKGDGQQMMMDSLGIPLKPRDLTAGIFKGSSSSEDIYDRMVAGIPGSPMPGYQGVFTDEQMWDLIHYVQTLPKSGAEARSHVQRMTIPVKKVKILDADPFAGQWSQIPPVFVALVPLWWRNDRIEGVEVRAVHDGKRIAIHLSWEDSSKDDSNAAIQNFSDGAAIQFSPEKNPPSFAMGGSEHAVTIWNWKAAWQADLVWRVDIENKYPNAAVDIQFHNPRFITGWGVGNPLSNPQRNSAAEEAMAKGLGTLTTQMPRFEKVHVNGVWKDGRWRLVFSRELATKDWFALKFREGSFVHVAFAVWDGSKRDRNGQKMVSIWNELDLEK